MGCLTSQYWPDTLRLAVKASSYSEAVCVSYIPAALIATSNTVIHLQFWAYGSWDLLFPISMSLNANL